MKIDVIDLRSLKDVSELSPVRCADLAEAAAVCLDYHHHKQQTDIHLLGDLTNQFKLVWQEVDQKMRDSRNDMENTVEHGAYCLAMLVIEKEVGLKVTKQSQKRTGFDYWLSSSNDKGLQGYARLEVSGILKGTKHQVSYRLKEKVQQTQKSDNLNIPAYVVVVEFSTPQAFIRKR